MILSAMAIMDLQIRLHAVLDVFRRPIRQPDPAVGDAAPEIVEVVCSELKAPTTVTDLADFRWRRHPQLRNAAATRVLSAHQRRARQHAVRGMYSGHHGDLAGAHHQFALALDADDIDLTETPFFWTMPRSAILAAADACEQAGRFREAATIQARVRTEFRPRVLASPPRLNQPSFLRQSVAGS